MISGTNTTTCRKTDMQLTQLIYTSNHGGISINAPNGILQLSRLNNVRDAISGALIISSQDFVQLLEGPREAIARCLKRIMLDNRHRDLNVVYANDAEIRLFPHRSMYAVKTSALRRELFAKQLEEGTFDPFGLPATGFKQLFQSLSHRAKAASLDRAFQTIQTGRKPTVDPAFADELVRREIFGGP